MKKNFLTITSIAFAASMLFSCAKTQDSVPIGQAEGTLAVVKDSVTLATKTLADALAPTVVSQSQDKMVIDVAGQRVELSIVDGQLMASSGRKASGNRKAPKAFSGTGTAAAGTWSAVVLNLDKKGLMALAKDIKDNADNPFENLFGEEVGDLFEGSIDNDFEFKPKLNQKKLPKGFFYVDGKISAKRKADLLSNSGGNGEPMPNPYAPVVVQELKVSESGVTKVASITADAGLAGFYIDKFKYRQMGRAKNNQNWFLGTTDMEEYMDSDDNKDSKDYIIGNGVQYPGGMKKNSIAFTFMVGLGKANNGGTPSRLNGIVLGVAMKYKGSEKNPTSVSVVIFAGVFGGLKM